MMVGKAAAVALGGGQARTAGADIKGAVADRSNVVADGQLAVRTALAETATSRRVVLAPGLGGDLAPAAGAPDGAGISGPPSAVVPDLSGSAQSSAEDEQLTSDTEAATSLTGRPAMYSFTFGGHRAVLAVSSEGLQLTDLENARRSVSSACNGVRSFGMSTRAPDTPKLRIELVEKTIELADGPVAQAVSSMEEACQRQ